MSSRIGIHILSVLLFLSALPCSSASSSLRNYMDSQSLKWEQLPLQWNEGAFLGNGQVGMMVYVDTADNSLTLWLSRPDVTDHRKAPDRPTSMGVPGANVMIDYCRMDIGKMKMYPEGRILSGEFELDIYDAELRGSLHTDRGEIRILAYTPYDYDANIVEYECSQPVRWELHPGSPVSPRVQVFPETRNAIDYKDNPSPECVSLVDEGWSVHRLLAGGDYSTYWRVFSTPSGHALCVSTKNCVPLEGRSLKIARRTVRRLSGMDLSKVRSEMHAWWHSYYDTGLVSIPDKKLENFYTIQLYKLATCSRPDGPVMDVLGTFYKTTQWPGIWWNLNVQLTYMSTLTTNRLSQASNYRDLLDSSLFDILKATGTEKVGDFAWALYIYYSYLRYSGSSWKEIGRCLSPKAIGILDIYRSHLHDDGTTVSLLQTESPEYEGFEVYDNSNYNLAALRWILTVLIEIHEHTGMHGDLYAGWKDLLSRLHPDPVDENGYMIASGKPLAMSHRHYSHLISFYPLRLHDPTDPATSSLLEKSIDHWMTVGQGRGLAGYSFTGGASLYAYLGNGDKAYSQLYRFLNRPIGISLLLPNTMYVESGGRNPTIETPLSAATALSEMLLQSWGGTIRPFHAVPSSWKDCSFHRLRAEGGFDVSGLMSGGRVEWVEIYSHSGNPCRVHLPGWDEVHVSSDVPVRHLGGDVYEVSLKKGRTVSLSRQPGKHFTYVQSIPSEDEGRNFYGVKKGCGLKWQMDWPVK